jgi:hypothetical protein
MVKVFSKYVIAQFGGSSEAAIHAPYHKEVISILEAYKRMDGRKKQRFKKLHLSRSLLLPAGSSRKWPKVSEDSTGLLKPVPTVDSALWSGTRCVSLVPTVG